MSKRSRSNTPPEARQASNRPPMKRLQEASPVISTSSANAPNDKSSSAPISKSTSDHGKKDASDSKSEATLRIESFSENLKAASEDGSIAALATRPASEDCKAASGDKSFTAATTEPTSESTPKGSGTIPYATSTQHLSTPEDVLSDHWSWVTSMTRKSSRPQSLYDDVKDINIKTSELGDVERIAFQEMLVDLRSGNDLGSDHVRRLTILSFSQEPLYQYRMLLGGCRFLQDLTVGFCEEEMQDFIARESPSDFASGSGLESLCQTALQKLTIFKAPDANIDSMPRNRSTAKTPKAKVARKAKPADGPETDAWVERLVAHLHNVASSNGNSELRIIADAFSSSDAA
ncbi:hypothetical protein J4E86_008794 [Alternaria arbusti]|uniref:uncharacterized protein n=1 Tax=Alternaria arbusti TaxID=232088 RepID=UPI00221E8BF5|nr:uncharacterized protein J4E86_008794 [Alternaria arbusti]KAI4947169.1 hypothetical protein J4E86_008794 [Alternaria arbusti]